MTPDERDQQQLAAEKSIIIERIVLRIETQGGVVDSARKDSMKELSKQELEELADELSAASDSRDAITKVVRAISASRDAQRMAYEQKYDGLSGPAEVSM